MAITEQQFDALIQRLENVARRQPGLYKLRVGLLALLGYAYIFSVLAGLLAVLALLVLAVFWSGRINFYMVKLGILILVPVSIILKSLWVTFPPPTGLELHRHQVPRLFQLIDKLTKALDAPRFHRILLTDDFNAGVFQRPRLGIFGWQQNYLLLGLPLMQALSPAQLSAVLAHELGHLSGNHSRFNAWIYRVRQTYFQILQRLQPSDGQGSSVLFQGFFNWYAPFFSAYSFVLARMNEYEADRCAKEIAGAQNMAEALINVEIKGKFLQGSFWPGVLKQVSERVEPPATTFTNMSGALAAGFSNQDAAQWLDQALAQKTSNGDTHPCLADRLSALGYLGAGREQLPVPAAVGVSAAQEYLGNALPKLTAYFDLTWKEQNETPWRQKYASVQESLKQLRELESKAKKGQLKEEEAWNRAHLTAELKGSEAGIPLLRELLANHPTHAGANYLLGQILLEQNDATGIGHIEKAMSGNPHNVIPCCEAIYYWLKQQGKLEEAKLYQERAEKHCEIMLRSQQERYFVSGDELTPHNLPPAAVHELRQQLSGYPQVKEAYLAQKVVKYFPEQPLYVLGVTVQRAWYKLAVSDGDAKLLNKLASELNFPGGAYVLVINPVSDESGCSKKIGKILRKIEGAAIYRY
ncbi:MAG: M48 family metalloprotease [Oscillatoria princeps RMCB-10]|nr:M48 family metalloprotease [Oscillatoria princeps RMCB-10]